MISYILSYISYFSYFKMVLLPHCWHRHCFDSPFITTWLKVSRFILSLLFQRCWEIVLVGFCHTFPGFQAQAHVKTWTMDYYSHEFLQNNLQEFTAVAFLIKWKKVTTTFWNRFAQDKLTRTGQINQHLPYLHYTLWKDLALVRLHVFSQLLTSTLLTKLDLATNSWWQRWQLCCLFWQQENCFHPIFNQMFPWFPFEV